MNKGLSEAIGFALYIRGQNIVNRCRGNSKNDWHTDVHYRHTLISMVAHIELADMQHEREVH